MKGGISSSSGGGRGGEESVSLDLLKTKMEDFAKERNWEPFHTPRNLLLAMVYLFLLSPSQTHSPFILGFLCYSIFYIY